MPFTASHVLAVLPLAKARQLSFVALCIGAMIPDFTLFFPPHSYQLAHSLIGLFLYCLPVGLIVYFLYIHFGKQFVIDLSPMWIKQRLARYRDRHIPYNLYNLIMISLCIVLGAVTHIIWDNFSHSYGWGLKVFPVLSQNVEIFNFSLPYFKVVQHGSTLVAAPIIMLLSYLVLKRLKPEPTANCKTISPFVILILAAIFVTIPAIITAYYLVGGSSILFTFEKLVITTLSIYITLFFALSFLHGLNIFTMRRST